VPKNPPAFSPKTGAKLDGRTKTARMLTATRRGLLEHIGGKASVTQAGMIDRAAWLTLRLAQYDARTAKGETLTREETACYASLSSSLARILDRLGTQPAPPPKPKTLADHLAERRGQAA